MVKIVVKEFPMPVVMGIGKALRRVIYSTKIFRKEEIAMHLQNKRENYMSYWHFSKQEKDDLTKKLETQLPALRGAIGATQEEIASAIGISRQSYGCIENQQRKMSWNVYMSLIFFFDYTPGSHDLIRKLDVFPSRLDKLLPVSIANG